MLDSLPIRNRTKSRYALLHQRSRAIALGSSRRPMLRSMNLRPPFAQKREELDALAQPAPHHLRASHHLGDDGRNFGGSEIKASIQLLDRLKDFGVTEMRVVQWRKLNAIGIDEI